MSGNSGKRAWYQDGLRFECTQCGACCSGEPGFVWVNPQEIRDMATALAIDEETFRDKFVRRVGTRYSLVEYPDGDCILLDPKTRGCMVYQARPAQCRTWPFWNSNLTSKEAWKDACEVCPGAGMGTLYSIEQIESARKQRRV